MSVGLRERLQTCVFCVCVGCLRCQQSCPLVARSKCLASKLFILQYIVPGVVDQNRTFLLQGERLVGTPVNVIS